MKVYYIFLIALFIGLNTYAQEKTLEYTIEDAFKVKDYNYLDSDNFFVIQNAKSKKSKIRTKFTLFDTDLNIINNYTDSEEIYASSFHYYSKTGNHVLIREKDKYALLTDKKNDFSDKNLDDDITDVFYFDSSGERFIDVVKINFLTNTKFVSIGRKEGKKHYKKGRYNEIEIFLFNKDLKSQQSTYNKLELPKNTNFYSLGPKLLSYDENSFVLSYLWDGDSLTERSYLIAKYDYNGRIIQEFRLPVKVENDNQKFTVLNIGEYSFGSYNPRDLTTGRKKYIMSYAYPTTDARGNVYYDKYDDSYYAYVAIKPNKGDAEVLIYKYDNSGNIVWRQSYALPDTKLPFINSANRYLKFDVSSKFVGVTLYSQKGKNYCDFYLFNKENGEMFKSKTFRKFKFYKTSKNYNNFYSTFILNDDSFNNLVLDRKTILSSLYNEEFSDYLKQANNSIESNLIISYFTKNGVNTLTSPKKENKITFSKFVF